MSKNESYDIARREFYRLRHQEEIERHVAAEEAEATGAVFGPRQLEIGMQLENQEFERWKAWARAQVHLSNQNSNASSADPSADTSGGDDEGNVNETNQTTSRP